MVKREAMQARRYQDLIAWQKAIALVKSVYETTSSFPQKEVFGLTSQMRRSAVSIPSNIAEGQGRATRGEFHQFLGHARGSLYELETQFVIASELGYISAGQGDCLLADSRELGRILNALMSSVSEQQMSARVLTTDN
jgi:four helix bundle protein